MCMSNNSITLYDKFVLIAKFQFEIAFCSIVSFCNKVFETMNIIKKIHNQTNVGVSQDNLLKIQDYLSSSFM